MTDTNNFRQLTDSDFRALADEMLAKLVTVGAVAEYNRDLVAWLYGYIERLRDLWREEQFDQVANNLGAVLGECLRAVYGGTWSFHEQAEAWGVYVGSGLGTVFPSAKVYKQLRNGPEDSVLSLFDVVGSIIAAGGIDKFRSMQKNTEG